jgi:ribosomal protein L11 methyltransferase
MKEYLGTTLLAPRRTPYREIFVSRISGSAPLMAEHFRDSMLASWEQDGVTEILFEDPHGEEVHAYISSNYPDAAFEGEIGIPYSDWESGEPVRPLEAAGFRISYTWDRGGGDNAGDSRIVLDPGLAFGTGHHPSTKQSLALLRTAFENGPRPRTVLDLGCGSGVLSVAAAALGAQSVIAVDYSLVAAHAARMNAQLNRADQCVRVIHGDAFDNLERGADLALCNLNHTLIKKLLARSHSFKAARMILSGIHGHDRFDEIRHACGGAGLVILATEQQGLWFSCLCAAGG